MNICVSQRAFFGFCRHPPPPFLFFLPTSLHPLCVLCVPCAHTHAHARVHLPPPLHTTPRCFLDAHTHNYVPPQRGLFTHTRALSLLLPLTRTHTEENHFFSASLPPPPLPRNHQTSINPPQQQPPLPRPHALTHTRFVHVLAPPSPLRKPSSNLPQTTHHLLTLPRALLSTNQKTHVFLQLFPCWGARSAPSTPLFCVSCLLFAANAQANNYHFCSKESAPPRFSSQPPPTPHQTFPPCPSAPRTQSGAPPSSVHPPFLPSTRRACPRARTQKNSFQLPFLHIHASALSNRPQAPDTHPSSLSLLFFPRTTQHFHLPS